MTAAPTSAIMGFVAASQQAPQLAPAPSGPRQVERGMSPRVLRLVQPRAFRDGDVDARSARARAGHALSVVGLVVHRAALPLALLALMMLTLSAVAGALPATDGLVAAVPLIESVGAWGESVLRTAVSAVGVLVVLRLVSIALAAGAWLVFPPGHRELLAELSRRAVEEEEEGRR